MVAETSYLLQENKKKKNAASKLEYLDGIRGWAAFSVVIYHMVNHLFNDLANQQPTRPAYQTFLWTRIFWNGRFAVTVFFILSGRVLALGFLKTGDTSRLISSALRRPFRLFFPALISIYFFVIAYKLDLYQNKRKEPFDWFHLRVETVPTIYDSFQTALLLFIPNYSDPPFAPVTVYWTLPLEFVNSYIVYMVALVANGINQKLLLYFVIFSVNVLNNLNSWTAPFIIGLFLAELSVSGLFQGCSKGLFGLFIKIALAFVGFTVWYLDFWDLVPGKQHSKMAENFSYLTITNRRIPNLKQLNVADLIVASCLLIVAEMSDYVRGFFGSKPFIFLGKISFGMYLMHPFVLITSSAYLLEILLASKYDFSLYQIKLALIAATLIVVIPLSWLFYYIADEPSINIGKWVENNCFRKKWTTSKFIFLVRRFKTTLGSKLWVSRLKERITEIRRKSSHEIEPNSPSRKERIL